MAPHFITCAFGVHRNFDEILRFSIGAISVRPSMWDWNVWLCIQFDLFRSSGRKKTNHRYEIATGKEWSSSRSSWIIEVHLSLSRPRTHTLHWMKSRPESEALAYSSKRLYAEMPMKENDVRKISASHIVFISLRRAFFVTTKVCILIPDPAEFQCANRGNVFYWTGLPPLPHIEFSSEGFYRSLLSKY